MESKLRDEVEKLKQKLSASEKRLNEEESRRIKLEQKVVIAEKTSESYRKELLLLQRQLKESNKLPSSSDRQPNNVQITNGRLGECPSCSAFKNEVDDLKKKCKDLKDCVAKLNKLTDILRRQKILLEAGLLLSIKEKDIEPFLELNK